MSTIIVGIDGSSSAAGALRWALDQADQDDTVVATYAWQVPGVGSLELWDNPAEVEIEAKQLVDRLVAEVVAGRRGDQPEVVSRQRHGHPGKILLDESEAADLLVVGTRGRGGFSGLMLGSVSTYVVHHARCPVVIVPDSNERSTAS